jgi:Transposase zinc-binding domain/Putative transposase
VAFVSTYVPRRPEQTVLHRVVREHLASFERLMLEQYGRPLPRYVSEELRRYLDCGIWAHGFTRCFCDACGRDILVPFSCKCRGTCPSCMSRRMHQTAAAITDRLLPDIPVRQWVLSLPFELRFLAAFKADVLRQMARLLSETIARWQKDRSGHPDAGTGAIVFVQRFGSSLNLHVHYHLVVPDGVFIRAGQHARFVPLEPPLLAQLEEIVQRVAQRALRWLDRKGYLDPRCREERPNCAEEPSALEACAQMALGPGGSFATLDEKALDDGDAPAFDQGRTPRFSARHMGFDLHAAVRVEQGDDIGRERLLRYSTPSSFARWGTPAAPDPRSPSSD